MKKSISLTFFLFTFAAFAFAQQSVHLEHQLLHPGNFSEQEWNKKLNLDVSEHKSGNVPVRKLQKEVVGWHPYWMGTSYNNYDFSLLSEISYFSYEVEPTTGSYKNIYNWKTTPLVEMAHEAGVKVSLCVTLFENHSAILTVPERQVTLIDSLISLVKQRNADGVNIDFEMVPGGLRTQMANFMIQLSNRFHAEIPGSRVSIALPAVDWNNSFDVVAMTPYVDLFIIMGYEYYWSGSKNAGPVAPRNGGTVWGNYNVTKTAIDYLVKGVPREKLLMGLPYYGRRWKTVSDALFAQTTETGKSFTYAQVLTELATVTPKWDDNASNPYFVKNEAGVYTQYWYDDAKSLERKYDMINTLGLGGIGIWALGYDGTSKHLWNALENKFTGIVPAYSNFLFDDLGGLREKYQHKTQFEYHFTSAFGQASWVLDSMAVEEDFDTLEVLSHTPNGLKQLRMYTGKYKLDEITPEWNNLVFRFTSDGATNDFGWVSYLKQKSVNGYSAYAQIPDFANSNFAHLLRRNFPVSDTVYSFVISGKRNDGAFLTQPLQAASYYSFQENSSDWITSGNGITFNTNGLEINTLTQNTLSKTIKNVQNGHLLSTHFSISDFMASGYFSLAINDNSMSASPIANRLIIKISPETKKLLVFRENMSSEILFTHTFENLKDIDIQLFFGKGNNNALLWVNNLPAATFLAQFTEQTDYMVSIETENVKANATHFAIWDNAPENKEWSLSQDFLPINNNTAPADTLVLLFKHLALKSEFKLNHIEQIISDTIAPLKPTWVSDITLADADTLPTVHQVTVYWDDINADKNVEYYAGIGKSTEKPDVIPFVHTANNKSFTFLATGFQENTLYRTFVMAKDKSGNYSDVSVSDGFYASIPLSIFSGRKNNELNVNIYPNPCTHFLQIETEKNLSQKMEFRVMDVNGNVLIQKSDFMLQKYGLDVHELASGTYFLEVVGNETYFKKSFIKM